MSASCDHGPRADASQGMLRWERIVRVKYTVISVE